MGKHLNNQNQNQNEYKKEIFFVYHLNIIILLNNLQIKLDYANG